MKLKAYLAGPFISYTEREFERDSIAWEIASEYLDLNYNQIMKSYEDWRDLTKKMGQKYFPSIEFLDPRETGATSLGGKHGFLQKDLDLIEESDLVIAYRPYRIERINGKKISRKIEMEGTSAEMQHAYDHKKTILYVDENEAPHEFLIGLALMPFHSLPALYLYLYFTHNEGVFPAVNKIHEVF